MIYSAGAEPGLVVYGGVNALLVVLVYAAKFLPRLNWSSPIMRTKLGGGHVVPSGASLEAVTAGVAVNAASSINLGCLFVIFGLFIAFWAFIMGAIGVPAYFGWIQSVTRLNLIIMIFSGLSWMFICLRLAVTGGIFLWYALKLLFGILVLGFVALCVGYLYTFVTGDRSAFEYVSGQFHRYYYRDRYADVHEPTSSISYRQRVDYNQCVIYYGVLTVADVGAVGKRCAPILSPDNTGLQYRWGWGRGV